MNLPVEVIEAVRENRCAIFAGSRCSAEAAEAAGRPFPTGKDLAKELGWTKPRLLPGMRPTPKTPSVRGGARVYQSASSREALIALLRARVGAVDVAPSSAHVAIVQRFPVIYTTAWDDLFERAAADAGRTVHLHYRGDPLPEPTGDETAVYKLNGGLEKPDSLVLTPDDTDAHPLSTAVQKQFRQLLRKHVILFIGHRPDEEEFEALFTDLSDCYGGELPRCHLAVAQGRIDDYQWQRWVWRGLLLFTADPIECMDALAEHTTA
jgi:hypothetical protein